MTTELTYIEIPPRPGSQVTISLGDSVLVLVPRYNYAAELWTLDIIDTEGTVLVAGLMVIPNIDLLIPYPSVGATVGSLVAIEQTVGDHKLTNSMGTKVKFLWFAPGEEITLPS